MTLLPKPPCDCPTQCVYHTMEGDVWRLKQCEWSWLPGFIRAVRALDGREVMVYWLKCKRIEV